MRQAGDEFPNSVGRGAGRYLPFLARTETHIERVRPVSYDSMKFIFYRQGTAVLLSGGAQFRVAEGDLVVLSAGVKCGAIPRGAVVTSTLYLDPDYLHDLVFWQYSPHLADRRQAVDVVAEIVKDPVLVLRPGQRAMARIVPVLDEVVEMSSQLGPSERFFRRQALLSTLFDWMEPFLPAPPIALPPIDGGGVGFPRHREFSPIRSEVQAVEALLRSDPARAWTLSALALEVRLSAAQIGRLFPVSYGTTPFAYLSMLRVDYMARLLRTTSSPVSEIVALSGWRSQAHATERFKRQVGIGPLQYRRLHLKKFRTE